MNWLISGKSNHICVSCKLSSFPHIHPASGSSGGHGGPNAPLLTPREMNWFHELMTEWAQELRTVEDQLSQSCFEYVSGRPNSTYVGLVLYIGVNLISFRDLKALSQKAEEKTEGECFQQWEMRASRVLASSIPQTPRTRREVVCPECVIPKAQGHLTGRERALKQEPPCTKRSPCPTVQMPGERNIRGSGMVRGAGMSGMGKTNQSITVTCSLLSGGMISPCTTCASQVSQCTYGMYSDMVRRGEIRAGQGGNLVQQESQFPLRLSQSLGQPRL